MSREGWSARDGMFRPGLIDSTAPDGRSAADLLGPEHPLARACDAYDGAVRQCGALVMPLCCGAVAAALGASWGGPLLGAAAVTAVVLLGRVATLHQLRNSCVLDFLIHANADVPLRPVQRMRLELEDMRTRARQAKTLDDIRCAAERSAIDRYPLTSRRAIIAASTELQEVAHLLRQPPTSVPGVARVRLLLTAAGSPLYGTDGFALREELHQIRFLLQRGQPARDGGPESPPRVMSPVRRLR